MHVMPNKKNKIYKSLFILFLVIVICVGIFSPVAISHLKNTWVEKSDIITKQIAAESKEAIIQKELKLSDILSDIKKHIETDSSCLLTKQNEFLTYLKIKYPHNSVIITDSLGNYVLWLNGINGFSKSANIHYSNELFFYDSGIKIYLGQTDNVTLFNKSYKIFLFTQVKKMYHLPEYNNDNPSLEEELSLKFDTKFKIDYSTKTQLSNDGGYFSYPLLDKYKHRIGTVTFQKPILNKRVSELNREISIVQSLIFMFGIIMLFLYYLPNVLYIKNNLFRLVIYIVLIAGFRVVVFVFGFPSKIVNSELLNPKYFSSQFAFGIVKSPLEFFITGIFAVTISIVIFLFVRKHFVKKRSTNNLFRFWLSAAVVGVMTLLLVRTIGAMSKSVIFDSSIFYFSDFNLISKPPAILMQINVLLAGFAIFTVIISAYTFVLSLLNTDGTAKREVILSFFLILETLGVVYNFVQLSPQVDIFIRSVILLFLFLTAYLIFEKKLSLSKTLLSIAFVASFSTALLLNYYNAQEEKESLKNLAHDLSKSESNWYQYLVNQTITSSEFRKMALTSITESQKFSSDIAAFKIWSNSVLVNETERMQVEISNRDFTKVGSFNLGFPLNISPNYSSIHNPLSSPVYIRKNSSKNNGELISGISPLMKGDTLMGYLSVNILNEKSLDNPNILPGFLNKTEPFVNPAINDQKLSIYEFYNSKLISQNSDVSLNSQNINQILKADYSKLNEAWIYTNLANETYTLYAYKPTVNDGNKIIVVGLREKEISFSLFHFFKVLFVHSILIISILLIYFLFVIGKSRKVIWSFNAKLFAAFVIISIVPLIIMAVSIRELTVEKNNSAIYYKLEKRAKSVEKYLRNHASVPFVVSKNYYNKVSQDLDINFTLYRNKEFIYSSQEQYFDVGLMHKLISSAAYYGQNNLGLKIYVEKKNIGGYNFNSLYYKTKISGTDLVIEINDAFNPISLPMSGTELDIFLFGSYSLAIILIIAFSTLLAKQISSPIRQLTLAAKSVAEGDLNLELYQNDKGEVKDLINEFNYMVKELKKSQSALAVSERETAWKEMAKQVAHEVKNPLTPMKLSVQQLIIAYKEKSPKFDKIFNTVTDTLVKQIEILKNIASEFSSFARMPSLKIEKMDLLNTLSDVKDLFSEENVEISFIANEEIIYINADADQLKRTLINLVRNSIQARAKNIELKVTTINQFAEVRVIDDGQGISPERLNKVFDVDFTTKEKGMGLGLSIAKKSIENIGGEIFVENTSPEGTVMLIKIQKV